jgi:hypothetical protein
LQAAVRRPIPVPVQIVVRLNICTTNDIAQQLQLLFFVWPMSAKIADNGQPSCIKVVVSDDTRIHNSPGSSSSVGKILPYWQGKRSEVQAVISFHQLVLKHLQFTFLPWTKQVASMKMQGDSMNRATQPSCSCGPRDCIRGGRGVLPQCTEMSILVAFPHCALSTICMYYSLFYLNYTNTL